MSTPLFSIVVPIYNVEHYIEPCLDSLLAQSYKDFEVLLVNDGSRDSSVSLAQRYVALDARFKLINKTNGGLSSARNCGIRQAAGDYVLFLDSDDSLLPETLQHIFEAIDTYHAPEIIRIHFAAYNDTDGTPMMQKYGTLSEKIINHVFSGAEFYALWHCAPVMAYLNVCKRDLFRNPELFFYEGIIHEDEEWSPRIILTAKTIVQLQFPDYQYRIRQGSIMTEYRLDAHFTGLLCALLHLASFSQKLDKRTSLYKQLNYDIIERVFDLTLDIQKQHQLSLYTPRLLEIIRLVYPAIAFKHKLYTCLYRISPRLYLKILSLRLLFLSHKKEK